MDHIKSSDNIAALKYSISMKSQYLIKITPLLVSISLCSFLYSPSSLLAFLQCFNFYFSTIPFQLFTHTIDKNCMFLLCNGLLVFVGITRTFSGSNAKNDGEQSEYMIEDGSESQSLEIEISQPLLEEAEVTMSSEPDEQKYAAEEAAKIECLIKDAEEDVEKAIVEDEDQEKETSLAEEEQEDQESAVLNEEEENIEQGTIDEFTIEESLEEEEEEEEEVEEENWAITTEEMNKKFDDFIRRMKADLKIEAQRQLIMV